MLKVFISSPICKSEVNRIISLSYPHFVKVDRRKIPSLAPLTKEAKGGVDFVSLTQQRGLSLISHDKAITHPLLDKSAPYHPDKGGKGG